MSDELLKAKQNQEDLAKLLSAGAVLMSEHANEIDRLRSRVRELEAIIANWTARDEQYAQVVAERDAVAVANCPRLCDQFCNEHQTQRALERAEAERDKWYALAGKLEAEARQLDHERDALRALLRDMRAVEHSNVWHWTPRIDAALKEKP